MLDTAIRPTEILNAAPDAIALQLGLAPGRPHPLAAAGLSLREIAEAAGRKIRPQHSEPDIAVFARGLGSSDFGKLLADGVGLATVAAYDAAANEYLKVCTVVETKNFTPAGTPALDGDLGLKLLKEFEQIEQADVFTSAGGTAQLRTYARLVHISRTVIVNDGLGALQTMFAGAGSNAAQLEVGLLAQALEENPKLDDGADVFSATNSVATALSDTALGQAMALLRNQKNAAGNQMNLQARHLLVDPGQEYAAHKLIREAALPIDVVALAGLTTGRWFLLPSPQVHPVIGLLRLPGVKNPLSVKQERGFDVEGVLVRVIADTGVSILRRTGIVRGGSDLT